MRQRLITETVKWASMKRMKAISKDFLNLMQAHRWISRITSLTLTTDLRRCKAMMTTRTEVPLTTRRECRTILEEADRTEMILSWATSSTLRHLRTCLRKEVATIRRITITEIALSSTIMHLTTETRMTKIWDSLVLSSLVKETKMTSDQSNHFETTLSQNYNQ